MSCDCFIFEQEKDEFRMWQGLVGPYYTPAVDSLGNLSWTNNGQLVNPPTVNVSGRGLTITGIVDTSGDLPSSAPQYTVYLVGTTSPYHGYIFDGTSWVDLGIIGKGETGDPGADGFSPVVTVTPITGGHQVSIEDAVDTQTFNVMDGTDGQDGQGVPTGGSTGQVLAKASGTDYDTQWVNQSAGVDPATATPIMDGTGAVGTSAKYAREDHVHPSDTSKQDKITASGMLKGDGTGNISAASAGTDYQAPITTNGMLKGNGSAVSAATKGTDYGALSFTVTLVAANWNSSNAQTISNANILASGYVYIVSPASASFVTYGEAQIYADDVLTDGVMTFHCASAPSSDLTVNIARVVSA